MNIKDFIGNKVSFDKECGKFFGEDSKSGIQNIADVRGWGAIQNLFKNKKGEIDYFKATKFQDDLGDWIAEAINEKIEREKGLD